MITPTQRKKRKQNVGGSDLPAIVGVCPFSSAEDVRLEKCRDMVDLEPTDAMEMGNYMEEPIIAWLETKLGKIKRGGERRVPGTKMLIHLDGMVIKGGYPVEVKLSQYEGESWGGSGSSDVPDRVNVQLHGAMMAMEADKGYVGAATIRNGRMTFSWYEVPFDAALANFIKDKVHHFWHEHVLKDIPCESSRASLETLTRVKRKASSPRACASHVIDFWHHARMARLAAEKNEAFAKENLLAAMADGDGLEDDDRFLTYLEQRGAPKLDRDAMRVDGVFDKYATDTVIRKLSNIKTKEKPSD